MARPRHVITPSAATTPETYVGSERADGFVPKTTPGRRTYSATPAARLPLSRFTLGGTWANNSTINVNGGTFNMGGSTTNFGAISLANAQLNVKGNFTTAQVESIVDASTKVDIASGAIVDNTGDTIDFDHEPARRVEIKGPRAVQAGRLWDLVAILA